MFIFKPPYVEKTLLYVMFRRAIRQVVMVRLHTLSSWLPKHKDFARRYARESCYGFLCDVRGHIVYTGVTLCH